ncbi:DUF7263 family protein [Haloplanus halobius]|uniref:DUF7263 family protein n=1 Tax=Haloplanus halobius TaxID=2934938 RepID=UPI00200F82EB|nr:hypothetical protein [Haloplanus sp. XH21]
MRGQANLSALVVALTLLTGATVVGVTIADASLASADRDPTEQRAANAVADRLIAADAPTTLRANTLDAAVIETLNASRLVALVPSAAAGTFRVALDGTTLVERGEPGTGTTVRRGVLVASRMSAGSTMNLSQGATEQVPSRVDRVAVSIDPGPNTTVRTVYANGRVVLHDDAGLATTAAVHLSRYEPTTIRVDASQNATGEVRLTYRRVRVDERTLVVTVDA